MISKSKLVRLYLFAKWFVFGFNEIDKEYISSKFNIGQVVMLSGGHTRGICKDLQFPGFTTTVLKNARIQPEPSTLPVCLPSAAGPMGRWIQATASVKSLDIALLMVKTVLCVTNHHCALPVVVSCRPTVSWTLYSFPSRSLLQSGKLSHFLSADCCHPL